MRALGFPVVAGVHFLAGGAADAKSNFPATFPSMDGSDDPEKEEKKKRRKMGQTGGRAKRRACEEEEEAVATAGDAISSDIEDFSREETLKVRASLLRWYDANQRSLPWRTPTTTVTKAAGTVHGSGGGDGEDRAYAVWVSEVMLQQTQVSTVVGYYNRWMDKWPTVRHFAGASQEEVNDMWAGLGYYRRARFLLEGAKSIVEGGEFPRTASALREIRGIGDYTAGAIASIAFNEAVPVVDGNVVRVVTRLRAISANPKKSSTVKSIWNLAGQLVDPSRPGDFNQALMELGATLCSRSSPGCSSCPVSEHCHALALSRKFETIRVTDYPRKVKKAKQREDFAAVCIVEIREELDRNGKHMFLLVKRPDEGLLAGLWEFPSILLDGKKVDQATRRKAIDQYLKGSFDLDLRRNSSVILREDVGEYVHVFSHIRLHMHVELLVICLKGGENILHGEKEQKKITWKLVDDDTIQSMGLTSGIRKVYNMMKDLSRKRGR